MSVRRHLDDEQQLRVHLKAHLGAYLANGAVPLLLGIWFFGQFHDGLVDEILAIAISVTVVIAMLAVVRAFGHRLRPVVFRQRSRACLVALYLNAAGQLVPIVPMLFACVALWLLGIDLFPGDRLTLGHFAALAILVSLPYCAFVTLCFWPWSRGALRTAT